MLDSINWEKVNGLLPVIAQEQKSGIVLMLAYMNKEALELTIKTKLAHYYSRTKKRLWKKGEESGHIQKIEDMFLDCDNDTLLIKVMQVADTACHTGEKSCFFTNLISGEKVSFSNNNVLEKLYSIIKSKIEEDPNISYTAKLFNKGENEIVKKVIEEAGEFCFSIKDNDRDNIIYELADLTYHLLVALAYRDIKPDEIKIELKRRFGTSGIDEKNSRKNSYNK
jgi:phosphoribosyl-ATP pyrophosphohydrolase/phosphoribosyl-AMP cyclohydrolase